jgi:altronate dehydratase
MVRQFTEPNALRIDARDNVAVALKELRAGDGVSAAGVDDLAASMDVPFAHKIAVGDIRRGEPVLKYGVAIAFATRDIARGEWVDRHNAKSYFVAKKESQG